MVSRKKKKVSDNVYAERHETFVANANPPQNAPEVNAVPQEVAPHNRPISHPMHDAAILLAERHDSSVMNQEPPVPASDANAEKLANEVMNQEPLEHVPVANAEKLANEVMNQDPLENAPVAIADNELAPEGNMIEQVAAEDNAIQEDTVGEVEQQKYASAINMESVISKVKPTKSGRHRKLPMSAYRNPLVFSDANPAQKVAAVGNVHQENIVAGNKEGINADSVVLLPTQSDNTSKATSDQQRYTSSSDSSSGNDSDNSDSPGAASSSRKSSTCYYYYAPFTMFSKFYAIRPDISIHYQELIAKEMRCRSNLSNQSNWTNIIATWNKSAPSKKRYH